MLRAFCLKQMSRSSEPMPYWLQNLSYSQAQASCTALVTVTDPAQAAPVKPSVEAQAINNATRYDMDLPLFVSPNSAQTIKKTTARTRMLTIQNSLGFAR